MADAPGWLENLLNEALDLERSKPLELRLPMPQGPEATSSVALARIALPSLLHSSGLWYGTPLGVPSAAAAGNAPLDRAVLFAMARVAVALARVLDPRRSLKKEEVAAILAATFSAQKSLESVFRRGVNSLPGTFFKTLEGELEEATFSLRGSPTHGLVLHNGTIAIDADLFGRMSAAYVLKRHFDAPAVARRCRTAARRKAVLTQVLVGLWCAERTPTPTARRAILAQVRMLRLPDDIESEALELTRKTFDKAPRIQKTLGRVQSQKARRFLLEQTLLGSLVDGKRSNAEVAYVNRVAELFGFSPDDVKAMGIEMADFYRRHKNVIDLFTVAPLATELGDELVDNMSRAVKKNYRALVRELKETGELSVLLARAARGQTLTRDEKQQMRAQLIDVAKAIPALAIFAAPGGLFLFIALAKTLDINLLPSSFHEPEDDDAMG